MPDLLVSAKVDMGQRSRLRDQEQEPDHQKKMADSETDQGGHFVCRSHMTTPAGAAAGAAVDGDVDGVVGAGVGAAGVQRQGPGQNRFCPEGGPSATLKASDH